MLRLSKFAFATMAVFLCSVVHADTFANFSPTSASNTNFNFANNPNGGSPYVTLDTSNVVTGIPVNFNFSNIVGLPPALTGTLQANMLMTSTSTDPTASTGTRGNITYYQYFDTNISTITFNLDTPYLGHTTLLKVSWMTSPSSSSALVGGKGSGTASLTAQNSAGDTVNFSSDFLNFTGTGGHAFSMSLSGVNPTLLLNADGFLNSFSANMTGTFDAVPVPTLAPEPSSIVLGLTGIVFGAGFMRRRKAQTTA